MTKYLIVIIAALVAGVLLNLANKALGITDSTTVGAVTGGVVAGIGMLVLYTKGKKADGEGQDT
jgi:uncharacterized membrane-anchored protein YitT (DUF2179 family)